MARVKANSYGNGTVYMGENRFKNPDGTITESFGYFNSPSGKKTYTDHERNILVLSSDSDKVGTIYAHDKLVYAPTEIITESEIFEEAERLADGKTFEDFLITAAVRLGGENRANKR